MMATEWAGVGVDWSTPDPSACPVCHSEMCEDQTHYALPWWPAPDDGGAKGGPPSPSPLAFQSAESVIQTPPPFEVVEGVAFADRVTVLVAEPGGSKTFVALDIAAHVSAGIDWRGRTVHQGSVAYLSFEGDALNLRYQALRDAGHTIEHVHLLRPSEPLSPIYDRDRVERPSRGENVVGDALGTLVAELEAHQRPPVVLLVVDTVRASLAGSEDSSENVSAYLRAVRRLLRHVPGAAAVLTHHAGWQDGETKRKRERGSSAFRGNVDATLYLEAETYDRDTGTARLTLRTLKSRDTEPLPPLHLIRRRVELCGSNGRGEPLTSCVIDHDRRTREEREADKVEAVEAEHRETDLAVLGAMRDYPEATSISRLRVRVGLRTEAVSAAVGRILRAGWAVEGKRGEPYRLTEAGRAVLEGAI